MFQALIAFSTTSFKTGFVDCANFVLIGFGCSAVSAVTISNYCGKEDLVVRRIIEPEIDRELHIVYLKHTKIDSLLDKLAQLIKAHVHESIVLPNEDAEYLK